MTSSRFDTSEESALFHKGIKLFNEGDWFEAHETWEDIWRMANDEKKRFYQGLIQAAVTIEHLRRGNPRGARSVHGTCLPKFKGLPAVYMGINIQKFLADFERAVRPTLDLPSSHFDPARPRGQELPVDWEKIPTIELEYDPFDE